MQKAKFGHPNKKANLVASNADQTTRADSTQVCIGCVSDFHNRYHVTKWQTMPYCESCDIINSIHVQYLAKNKNTC